jgi:NADH-quinone oxidoreductase subunit N
MIEKIHALWPEIALFITTCIVMVVGLSPNRAVRRLCAPISGAGLIAAGVLAALTTASTHSPLPHLALFGKVLVAGVGLLLLLLVVGTVDREYEESVAPASYGRRAVWDAIRSTRAEFYSFFLFSLTGLMLCAGADDLIWLFLALELTSLPTYVMVSISTSRNRSMEAGVKYFFLGAFGAAVFLYGFTLLYGGTGFTRLDAIHTELARQAAEHGHINAIALTGLILSILGVCFKIAAVPMHFYTPDVYQGASATVAAFLAFVPKTAGFFAIMLLSASVGWGEGGLPDALRLTLWVIAALTMTVGNVLAILQSSVRRILAYSSIAHSGYMLVGVIAGPGPDSTRFSSNGLAAVLFYLLCYGVMNLGAFAVLACMERRAPDGTTEDIDSIEELRGLCQTRPVLGWTMVLSSMGLLGLPPLLGFLGKVPLFTAGIAAGEIPLVIILGVNSAIAAYYYLRLAAYPLLEKPDGAAATAQPTPFPTRRLAGLLSAAGVIVLAVFGGTLGEQASLAARTEAGPRPAKQPGATEQADASPPADPQ